MTIREMAEANPNRSTSPPESMFEVETDKGERLIMCWCDVLYRRWIEDYPDLMDWTVTKEHFTLEELDARQRAKR